MTQALPWHQLCTLRDDVRSGRLTMDEFAADLNGARTGEAPDVYREATLFFDRTFPTYRMKTMAAAVLSRLAGQGGNPVYRLQVAYGGGKTHTLITLLHLAEQGAALNDHATVREFVGFAGLSAAPRARVALLPGDKFDPVEGLIVRGPEGQMRRVTTLWGALAYQLAGDAGYARLKQHDEAFTIPGEPVLVDLLRAPQSQGLGSLVLIDEAVWYYRGLVNRDPRALGTIKDFFQVLTQAAAKVDRAVIVASLIASQIEAGDATGTQCLSALEDIFQRLAQPIEPVTRDDVAEILRRRLFAAVPGDAERQPAVDAMMAAMHSLPLSEQQRNQDAYAAFKDSYPFPPDLINVLYQKWTQLDTFQRTRGALRLLATALRESDGHDPAPFVGPGALLRHSEGGGLSPALNELVEILGDSPKWLPVLNGELAKARQLATDLPTLRQREIEQAVVATFLHSQPTGSGKRATPQELWALLAHPTVDRAGVEEGLRKWRDNSWFLVENPDYWQLGTTPNLMHMHHQVTAGVPETDIADELRRRVKSLNELKAADPGIDVHVLPASPRDVDDNLRLHYVILDPECAVTLGKPIPQAAEAYFKEKAGPRIYRNNVVALAPEAANVAGLREQVRRWLGWGRLEKAETFKLLTDEQKQSLPKKKTESENNLPESVVGAYRILLAVNEEGQVEAHTLPSSAGGTPFERIKNVLDDDERLVTSTLDPDLILPGSYLTLWAEGQPAQRVTALIEAFGQFPRLPRLLRPESLYDTLRRGVSTGALVLRLPRPDGTAQTWWRRLPDDDTLRRAEMEVQPVSAAVLDHLPPEQLAPGHLDDLWPESSSLTVDRLRGHFNGHTAPRLASNDVADAAVREAVKRGLLMADIGGRFLYREELPAGALDVATLLLPAPAPLRSADLTTHALPEAWTGNEARLQDIASALSAKRGHDVPWPLLVEAVDEALSLNLFEVVSGSWPCSPATINSLTFRVPEKIALQPEMIVTAMQYTTGGTPTLGTLKETVERQFLNGQAVAETDFVAQVQKAFSEQKLAALDTWDGRSLSVRVRVPNTVLFGETTLDALGLEKLAEAASKLFGLAAAMNVTFHVTLTLEGQAAEADTIEQINQLLDGVRKGWKVSG